MKQATKVFVAGVVSLTLAGAAFAAVSGQSGQGDDHDNDIALINQASVSLEQASSIALSDVSGKVIEAEIEYEDDVLVWEVEVLTDAGEVFEFEIDANSGSILEKEQEDN